MVKVVCSICGKDCVLGDTAIADPKNEEKDICVECLPFKRDKDGIFWLPEEKSQNRMKSDTEECYTITREEAFA